MDLQSKKYGRIKWVKCKRSAVIRTVVCCALIALFHKIILQAIRPHIDVILDTPLQHAPLTSQRASCNQTETVSDHYSQLDVPYIVPNTVFYAWCGTAKRHFEFRHYLSVRSVFRYLDPDRVVFYYEHEPRIDNMVYHTWFPELLEQYPTFVKQKIPRGWCQAKLKFVDDLLFRFGGIYVREDVIFTHRFDQRYRTFDAVAMGDVHSHQLVIARRRHFAYKDRANYSMSRETFYIMTGDSSMETSRVTLGTAMCQSETKIRPTKDFLSDTGNYSKPMIFIAVSKITPVSIWTLQTAAGRLLRTIMYNKSDVTVAIPSDRRLIPNKAHIIWLNNNTMNFQFYLCVLSLVEVVKVDKLYIHGDGPPTGYYWNLVKDHPKIVLVLRTLNGFQYETIYGDICIRTMEHMADVWRADILYRHGELYVDTDVLLFQPLDAEIRSFDTVMSKDVVLSYPFLNIYQSGVLLSKPGAKFFRLHLEAMKFFLDRDGLLNCGRQPYKIKERHPETVHEDPRLNVICTWSECHPTWNPSTVTEKAIRRRVA